MPIKTLLIILFLIINVFAWPTLEFGLSISNMQYKDSEDVGYKNSWCNQFGITKELQINNYFEFYPGLFLETKGQMAETKNENIIRTAKLNFTYFQFPLLSKFSFKSNSKKAFFFILGPEFGFLLKATRDEFGRIENLYDCANIFDFGIKPGFGFEIPGEQCILILKASYFYGLINASKDLKKYKNRNMQLSIGIGI